MDKKSKKPEAVKKSETTKKPEIKEVEIRCACAMGDLSEFAPVEPAEKKEKKIQKKIPKKSNSKNETSNKK